MRGYFEGWGLIWRWGSRIEMRRLSSRKSFLNNIMTRMEETPVVIVAQMIDRIREKLRVTMVLMSFLGGVAAVGEE